MSEVYDSNFYSSQMEGSRRAARHIAREIYNLIRPVSVVDVGCGMGAWLAAFQELGVGDLLGVDGDYVDRSKLLFDSSKFVASDLKRPLSVDRRFDLAVSLEVAEHLPMECASTFVGNLARLSDVVLFSAGIPFQGGVNHCNEQWQSYWSALFRNQGFQAIDAVRPKFWELPEVPWWYAQNTLLYVSSEMIDRNEGLRTLRQQTSLMPTDVVHPRKYLLDADPANISVRRATSLLVNAISRKLRTLIGTSYK